MAVSQQKKKQVACIGWNRLKLCCIIESLIIARKWNDKDFPGISNEFIHDKWILSKILPTEAL